MGFWTTAVAAALGVLASSLVKTLFDHFVSGASLKAAQQDDDLKGIVDFTEDVRDRAIAYWNGENELDQDRCDGGAITARLMFIGKLIEELFSSNEELERLVSAQLNRLDDAITSGNFMVSGRKPDSTRVPEIEERAFELIHSARKSRRLLKRHLIKA